MTIFDMGANTKQEEWIRVEKDDMQWVKPVEIPLMPLDDKPKRVYVPDLTQVDNDLLERAKHGRVELVVTMIDIEGNSVEAILGEQMIEVLWRQRRIWVR